MDSNFPNLPQAIRPFTSQIASFAPPSTYHPLLVTYPAASANHEAYNPQWGPEQVDAFLHHAMQIRGGDVSTTAVTMAATTNNDGYQCGWLTGGLLCGQGFANFDDLIIHLGRMHDVQGSAERPVVCQWLTDERSCGKQFRRDAFKRHISVHLGHSVTCAVCGKHFSRKDTMRAHSRKQHGM